MSHAVQALLRSFLQKHGHTWQMYLIQHWTTIVGTLHTRMCLEKIQDDTIIIGVYDVHWMQELFLLQPMLLERINQQFDKPYVKQIRLKLAKGVPKRAAQKKNKAASVVQRAPVPLTQQHHAALAQVKDQELHDALQTFLQHCKSS